MNRAQKRLTRRLQWLLIPPVLVATALLVLLSSLRMRAILRDHASAEARLIVGALLREQTTLALLEGVGLAIALGLAASWVAPPPSSKDS